jgi:K+-transporting ATPase KdpF subunit
MPHSTHISLYKILIPLSQIFIKPLHNNIHICIVQKEYNMKTLNFILGVVPPAIEGGSKAGEMNSPVWYIIGGLLTIFLFAYLIYALIKPEKF